MNVSSLMDALGGHVGLAYAVCFAGAFLETVIPFSFFVYGEVFFIAGSVLAGLGVLDVWTVSAVFIAAGVSGDSVSYAVGRKMGPGLFRPGRRYFSMKNYRRGKVFFLRYGGARAVFFGRLLGPMSWVTPFFAGMYRVSYPRFLAYDVPGVIVGIGQFVAAGVLFAHAWRRYLPVVQGYAAVIAGCLGAAVLVFVLVRKQRRTSRNAAGRQR